MLRFEKRRDEMKIMTRPGCVKAFWARYGNGLLSGAMIMMRNARSNVYELIDRVIDQLHNVRIINGIVYYSHSIDFFMRLLP